MIAENNKRVKAAVAWYGPVLSATSDIQPENRHRHGADQAEVPFARGCMATGQDQSIKVADVNAAEEKATDAGKIVKIVIYPDAPHGFNADYRPSYRKAEAEDGWKRMLEWFAAHGVKPAKL